ncbi:MAG: ThuA domain-containing protein [Verrucomicrobia bacterium]|nr:ThuA domain-containing protein [Verrucomicrobiota bacterium]
MNRLLLFISVFFASLFTHQSSLIASEPLRVYILSGLKTHRPGAHDHPTFLRDWVPMLNERGAKATGGDAFPTKEQLNQTDVLIIHRDGGGDFKPEERTLLDSYSKRGGGIVVIHAGSVANTDEGTDYYKSLIGGSWRKGTTKFFEGPLNLYFTDRENPITKDCSNFEMDDEIYYDMDLSPHIKVLAASYTPKPGNGRNGKSAKKATDLTSGGKVSVYDIQPQVWTYEAAHTDQGIQALGTFPVGGMVIPFRAFVCIPGHQYKNFSHPVMRALILRGIAWAGKRANADEFLRPHELGDNLRYVEGGPTHPSKAAEKLEVHPEFNISLVASEPLVNKVMNVDWDEKGRMWVCETPEYPNGRRKPETEVWKDSGSVIKENFEQRDPIDRISWLEDTNGDGIMDKKHVFADKLELVTSFVFYKNGVIATAAPDIWFLGDTTGNGVCDKRTKLYTGLGNGDTHAVINNARWGLDGWIYATNGYSTSNKVTNGDGTKNFGGYTAGVVRFKPDGSAFEQYSSKNSNTWGLCMTWDGQCFFTQPTCGDVLMHVVLPESVLAKGKIPSTNSYNVLMKGEKTFPLMKWEEQAYVQIDQVGRYTAAAGCAIYEGGAWPEKWNYSYFTTEPTINIVSHRFVTPDGVTYKAEKEKGREETEFIRSKDLWFRPIETRIGPDGALYVIDFYNQAVIHNDTRGPQHGPASAAVRPDRDHYFSRIWRVQHKDAKKLDVPVLDRKNFLSLAKVLETNPNAHVKQLAWRLLSEEAEATGNQKGIVGLAENGLSPHHGSLALSLYNELLMTPLAGSERANAIINVFHTASGDWLRSAAIAVAAESPVEVILAASSDEESGKLRPLIEALLPAALGKDGAANAVKLIESIESRRMNPMLLQGIAQQLNEVPALTTSLTDALKKVLANPATAGAALPLVAKWDTKGLLADAMKAGLAKLNATLVDAKAPIADRVNAARALISVGGDALQFVVTLLGGQDTPAELQSAIIQSFGEAGHAEILVANYDRLKAGLQTSAFDQILKRAEATQALLNAISEGRIKASTLSPSDVARLRTHPNKQIATMASKMLDQLISPATKEKNQLLAKLTPEVEKPGGSAEKGKLIFTATCAICHKFGKEGKEVGPILDGMGAHPPADLLVAVLDPNREVDPSFFAWNITKKNGEILAGIITQENTASLQLRNQAGTFEIRKDEIAKRENTQRSLMPEGLEALGAENLHDLMAFLNASETRFRIVNLASAYTADTRRGLFANEEAVNDSVHFSKFGNITAEGVPYFIQDPAKSSTGANVIVLKGGNGKNAAQQFPQRVEIAMHTPAKRLHFLSGIAGWGYPATKDDLPAMKVTIVHADGQSEVSELKNGDTFADYNRVIDVPGSENVEGIVSKGQLRRITLPVKNTSAITKLVMESNNNGIAPVVCAITADLEGSAGTPARIQNNNGGEAAKKNDADKSVRAPLDAAPVKWEPGKIKVLIIAGGSSHDFKKWFEDYDGVFLKEAGFSVNATEDSTTATAELKNADVAIISTNKKSFDTAEYRKALMDFADRGKGLIMLHPGTWYGFEQWPELNAKIVGGGARGHDAIAKFTVSVLKKDHPVMQGVPDSFTVEDELYHINSEPDKIPAGTAPIEVLAQTSPSKKYKAPHASIWVTKNDKARIVGIAIGHDERVHNLELYQKILINAVKWTSGK